VAAQRGNTVGGARRKRGKPTPSTDTSHSNAQKKKTDFRGRKPPEETLVSGGGGRGGKNTLSHATFYNHRRREHFTATGKSTHKELFVPTADDKREKSPHAAAELASLPPGKGEKRREPVRGRKGEISPKGSPTRNQHPMEAFKYRSATKKKRGEKRRRDGKLTAGVVGTLGEEKKGVQYTVTAPHGERKQSSH